MQIKIPKYFCFALVAAICFSQLGLFGKKSEDKIEDERQEIRDMRDEVLQAAYDEKPDLHKEITSAVGYAVFTNIGVNVIFGSFAGGKGIVVDNATGEETFMNMGSAGVGFGVGIKDFRGIFVFNNRSAMEGLVEKGWDFSAQADAAAKADTKGGSGETAGSALPGVKFYQFTKNGLALQATIQATKYWKSENLN